MLITAARHFSNSLTNLETTASDFLPLTGYMEALQWQKTVGGRKQVILRNPRPEVLLGDGQLLRQQIAMLHFARKYGSYVLSFAQSDIDVAAFNAGDPVLRRDVDLVLEFFLETAFAGIDRRARPIPFVTTHTHTGRLELNAAIPRMVLIDGKPRSYNPNPPVPRGQRPLYLGTVQDLANVTFGWADPGDPDREMLFKLPDWPEKQIAEARRMGLDEDGNEHLIYAKLREAIIDQVEAGEITSRNDLIAALNDHLIPYGRAVLRSGPNFMMVGPPDEGLSASVRLRGRIFDEGFSSKTLDRWHAGRDARKAQRAAVLADAGRRMSELFKRKADYNRRLFGPCATAAGNDWSVEHWLEKDRGAPPEIIPTRHHLHLLTPAKEKIDDGRANSLHSSTAHHGPVREADSRIGGGYHDTGPATGSDGNDDVGGDNRARTASGGTARAATGTGTPAEPQGPDPRDRPSGNRPRDRDRGDPANAPPRPRAGRGPDVGRRGLRQDPRPLGHHHPQLRSRDPEPYPGRLLPWRAKGPDPATRTFPDAMSQGKG